MTRSVPITITAKVFYSDDELNNFKALATAEGSPYPCDEDAITALAMSKVVFNLGEDVKEDDISVDID